MNLVQGAPLWLVTLLVLALVAAAAEDAIRLRISNITCLVVLLAAIAAMVAHGGSFSLWQNVTVFLIILMAGTAAFSAGLFGGGDIKLLAAIGLWFDLQGATALIVAVSLAGGVLALGFISARRVAGLGRPAKSGHGRIPYGLAIVAGAIFVFAVQFTDHPRNRLPDLVKYER